MLLDYRVRQRDYLLEIIRTLTQELDSEKLLNRILNIAVEMLAGQAGLIALRNSVSPRSSSPQEGEKYRSETEESRWTLTAYYGIPPAFLRYIEQFLASVPDHDDPARFEIPEISRLLQHFTEVVGFGVLTGVGLPLIVRDQVIGIIFIFRSYAGGFSANDRLILQSFADQAAIAVNNAKLYTQVTQQKQRLDALVDSAADGILILTPGHIVERGNPALGRLLGLSPAQIQGRHHDALIRWAGKQDGMTLEKAEAGGWPFSPGATLYIEGDVVRGQLPPLPVGITYAPLISQERGGGLLNIIATMRDISKFRQAEEIKTTFVSVIGHELKTPVALIKGYVATLRRDDASWDRSIVQDSLAVIEEEADRLTLLIENLLDASRLQAGVLKINQADVSMSSLAERLAERFRTQTQQHKFVVDFPDNFPVILGDEERLGQVIQNLLSNAIKYSPDGGEICISGQVRTDQVIVCVSDDGPGVAPEDAPHIFERFYRSNLATRTTKGVGLGLFLTRAIVEAHHGKIWVDSQVGKGARICFSLPRN